MLRRPLRENLGPEDKGGEGSSSRSYLSLLGFEAFWLKLHARHSVTPSGTDNDRLALLQQPLVKSLNPFTTLLESGGRLYGMVASQGIGI